MLTPRECYKFATVDDFDRIEQLLRRITSICYHFKTLSGDYSKLYFPSDYLRIDMENQVADTRKFLSEWVTIYDPERDGAGDSPKGVTAPAQEVLL